MWNNNIMAFGGILWISLLFFSVVKPQITQNDSVELQLRNYLLTNYNREIRPVRNVNSTVQVKVNFILSGIDNLDEKEQTLTTRGFLSIMWIDEYLTWNTQNFSGIDYFVTPAKNVWLPEIILFNGNYDLMELAYEKEDSRISIYPTGNVVWVVSFYLQTACRVNITKFPFDTQTCSVMFTNWMYGSRQCNLSKGAGEVELSQYQTHEEWSLEETSIIEIQRMGSAGRVTPIVGFRVQISRNPRYFVLQVIIPTTLLNFIMLIMFLLPVESGEKIGLGITVVLSYSIIMLIVNDVTPRTGVNIPVLLEVVTSQLVISGLALIQAAININIHFHSPHVSVPGWIKRLMFGPVEDTNKEGQYHQSPDENSTPNKNLSTTDLNTTSSQQLSTNGEDTASKEDTNRNEWEKLARVLDRLLFIFYGIISIACLIILFSLTMS